jgi:translation initiation factor IF-3
VVAEKAEPPVAKIIDFQKFKYQQAKKEKSGLVKSKSTQTKEIRFTPFMAKGDFQNRIDRSTEFLSSGYRIKLVVKFVGRQLSRKDFGSKVMFDAIQALNEFGTVEQEPKWQGKLFIAQIKPKKATANKTNEDQQNQD